jgi:hypothetical protein
MEKIYGNVWKPARVGRARTMQRVFCNQEYSTAVVVYTAAASDGCVRDGDATDEVHAASSRTPKFSTHASTTKF